MKRFQGVTDVITNPKHWPEVAKMPGKWLWHEVCLFRAPVDASTTGAAWIKISEKAARAFIIFAPIGLASFIMVYGAYKGIQGISRVYQNSSELQKFNAEVKRLEEEYNSILQAPCLPGLSNPQGQQFIERIDALVLQGKKFPGDHKALNQIEFQFKKLHKVRYCVINGEPAKGIRKDGVIPVEDHGNCFYEASCNALQLNGCFDSQPQVKITHEELRPKVIQWCQDNYSSDEYFRGLVETTIDTYIQVLEKEIADYKSTITLIEELGDHGRQMDTKKIEADIRNMEERVGYLKADAKAVSYFFYAAQPNFWAGNAECYALAKMYNICLTIRREGVDPQNCDKYNADSGGKAVEIEYDGRHFQTKIE